MDKQVFLSEDYMNSIIKAIRGAFSHGKYMIYKFKVPIAYTDVIDLDGEVMNVLGNHFNDIIKDSNETNTYYILNSEYIPLIGNWA